MRRSYSAFYRNVSEMELELWANLKDLFRSLPLPGEKPSVAELDRLISYICLNQRLYHLLKINQIRREEY